MFLKQVSSAHQGFIYLIENTEKSVQLWNIIVMYCFLCEFMLKCHLFLWSKLNFQCHVILPFLFFLLFNIFVEMEECLFQVEIVYSIIHVFTVIFDKLNACLLIKKSFESFCHGFHKIGSYVFNICFQHIRMMSDIKCVFNIYIDSFYLYIYIHIL